MSDTKHEVAVEFTAKDLTSAVIGKINKSAGVLGRTVDNITRKVAGFSALGGLATVFGLGASVAGANQYLKTIDDISTLTGMTANKTAGMQHAMEQSNLSAEDSRAIMITLAQKQSEIANGSKELAKQAKRWGIGLKKGPEAALISIADSVKKGKIGTGEIVTLLSESGAKAMDLFRKGPVEVQRLLSEGAKKNSHINTTSIAQYKQMTIQMTRVKQAWTRVTTIVMIKLAPALTKLMAYVERNIDGWTDGASRFGEYLVQHMDAALASARILGKVMMANYILMKLTGEGLVANSGKLLSLAKSSKKAGAAATGSGAVADVAAAAIGRPGAGAMISGRKGVAAKQAKAAAASALPFKHIRQSVKGIKLDMMLMLKGMGGRSKNIGKVFGKIFKFTTKIGGVFVRLYASVGPLIKVASMLMKLTVIGVVITAVVAGIKQIMSNVDGIRDRLGSLLGDIWKDIKSIGETIGGLFSEGSAMGKFFHWVGKAFVGVLEGVLLLVRKITRGIAIAAVMAAEGIFDIDQAKNFLSSREGNRRRDVYSKAYAVQTKLNDALQAGTVTTAAHVNQFNEMVDAYKEANMRQFAGMSKEQIKKKLGVFTERFGAVPTPSGRPQVHNDFRGSRFDIQQNFAEGFDPERIAVAFSNDLSALGERRLQSGLAPAFSAR